MQFSPPEQSALKPTCFDLSGAQAMPPPATEMPYSFGAPFLVLSPSKPFLGSDLGQVYGTGDSTEIFL